ncbi:MAG: ABC transporter ATP-binding protein [Hyphomicrobiales bacterium]|nr:ABC transporter ATP-binding protein [Hyphomicrobiales bacterium]
MTLEVRDLSIRFGGVAAVTNMSLDVNAREIVGLIGPNGAGKTTFINCIAGVAQPDTGAASWNGRAILGLSPADLLRLGVARTFQSVVSLHDLTVLDLVKLGAAAHARRGRGFLSQFFGSDKAVDEEICESLLAPLNLVDVANSPIQTLSYGQRKSVDLARALACEPQLLYLDEPVAGLTFQEGLNMGAVIRSVRDRFGCSVVMVEHKMDVVMSTCDRIVVMAHGARIFEGTPAETQKDAEVRRVYLGDA